MATKTVQTLSAEQISGAQAQADAIAASAPSAVSPNAFVFVAAFDGTNNIKDDPMFSGDKLSTAVGAMSDQVIQGANVQVGYYPGVGTPGTLPLSRAFPTDQAIVTAQKAYNEFAAAAAQWLANNPGGSVTTMLTSFSRGSVAAAIFSQMLYENGLVYVDPINNTSTMLIAPGEVNVPANLVISPVGTGAGGNLNFVNVGQTTVVLANNETRMLYKQSTYNDPGVTTIATLGNHGDIGSFYDNGLGGIYLDAYQQYFSKAGLNLAPLTDLTGRAYVPGVPVVIHAEVFDPLHPLDTFQNLFNYGLNTPLQTATVGKPAQTSLTSNGEVTTFVDYAGKTVTVNSIAGITQSVTITPPGETTGTTVYYNYQLDQPVIQTIPNADRAMLETEGQPTSLVTGGTVLGGPTAAEQVTFNDPILLNTPTADDTAAAPAVSVPADRLELDLKDGIINDSAERLSEYYDGTQETRLDPNLSSDSRSRDFEPNGDRSDFLRLTGQGLPGGWLSILAATAVPDHLLSHSDLPLSQQDVELRPVTAPLADVALADKQPLFESAASLAGQPTGDFGIQLEQQRLVGPSLLGSDATSSDSLAIAKRILGQNPFGDAGRLVVIDAILSVTDGTNARLNLSVFTDDERSVLEQLRDEGVLKLSPAVDSTSSSSGSGTSSDASTLSSSSSSGDSSDAGASTASG